MPQRWRFDLGATTHPGNAVAFRVWAPRAQRVAVHLHGSSPSSVPLRPGPGGFHETVLRGIAGSYSLVVDGGAERPDPFSRHQPAGPLGPSRVSQGPADRWIEPGRLRVAQALRPARLHRAVAPWPVAGSDPDVAATLGGRPGDAVLLGPVTEESAEHGLPGALFAPSRRAGGARALRALVEALHGKDLAVLLALPFDHLAPEMEFLLDFGPWLERRVEGDGFRLDLRTPQVRSLAVDAILGGIAEYRVDAVVLGTSEGWEGLDLLLGELGDRSRALGLAEAPVRLEGPASGRDGSRAPDPRQAREVRR